jgi:segregation and condensation protein B
MENEAEIEGHQKSIVSETVREIEEDDETERLKKIEAALFLSARFLSLQELVMLTDINPLMVRELIAKLFERYNKDDFAMEIVAKEDMWKMDVKKEYVYMINKLATGNAEFTKTEQETLAVIAYKQPVKQSVIIKIRGNKAYEHIKHFREIGLVQSKKVGHTLELKLSDDFFEYFHLQKKAGEEIVMDSMISDEMKERYEEAEKEVELEEQEGSSPGIEVEEAGGESEEEKEESKIKEKIEELEEKEEGIENVEEKGTGNIPGV